MNTMAAWMSPEEFGREQSRLQAVVAARYRSLSAADVEDVVAEALISSWRFSRRNGDAVTDSRRWLAKVALHTAAKYIERDKHARMTSLEAAGPIDQTRAATLSGGRQPLAEDFTATQAAIRERFAARSGLVAGLRRIRPLDVELFLDRKVNDLSYAQIVERRGVSPRQLHRAIERVSKFLTRVSGLVEAHELDERAAIALALEQAGLATPGERELAQRLLARPDGPELGAAVAEAMRKGVYLPALLGSGQPARDLSAPLAQADGAPALWQRISDALAAGRHQLVGWVATGKDSAVASAAQYAPASSGIRPGAAIGAALALCIGGATVCVDQGVLPSPLRPAITKRAPVDRSLKAPKPLRAAQPAKTAPPPTQTAPPPRQPVRLRMSQRRTALPASSPTSARGGEGHSSEVGGAASEFGIERADAGARAAGAGNEFGGGSSGGGSGGGASSGGDAAAREFGLP